MTAPPDRSWIEFQDGLGRTVKPALQVVAPRSCPHCRNLLTTRKFLARKARWCRRCLMVVQYITQAEHQAFIEEHPYP